jgi:hypothetical protein
VDTETTGLQALEVELVDILFLLRPSYASLHKASEDYRKATEGMQGFGGQADEALPIMFRGVA